MACPLVFVLGQVSFNRRFKTLNSNSWKKFSCTSFCFSHSFSCCSHLIECDDNLLVTFVISLPDPTSLTSSMYSRSTHNRGKPNHVPLCQCVVLWTIVYEYMTILSHNNPKYRGCLVPNCREIQTQCSYTGSL